MTRITLCLSDTGVPITHLCDKHGVLILPSSPVSQPKSDPLYILEFHFNAGAEVTYKGTLNHNFPPANTAFDRNNYHAHALTCSHTRDSIVKVPVYVPGTFSFYTEYRDFDDSPAKTETFYVLVPPILSIPLNSINVQLVVSKWIGPLKNWDVFFKRVADKGYNMVHFTPLQQRGESNSPYSIADQLRFDPGVFSSNEDAASLIHKILGRHSLLSMTDVVWNHTANTSEWIRKCPDAGYSAETAPHLRIAIELDSCLVKFSANYAVHGIEPLVTDVSHVDKIILALRPYLVAQSFWEYHVFEKIETIDFMMQLTDVSPLQGPHDFNPDSLSDVAKFALHECLENKAAVLRDRYSNRLEPRKFMSLVLAVLHPGADTADIRAKANAIIDEINLDLYASYDNDLNTILTSLDGRIKYTRLDPNGPKLGPISAKEPLFEPYFTRFTDYDGKPRALANNGWIWGGNPLVDFALDKSRAYWRREVIVWGDCVKLRYGSNYQDSPRLWDRMIEYTKMCAQVFDAFRIDNCHLTPIHVGEALLNAARLVNPNLYVVAELFLGLETMDKIFVERLGINSLIREAMQAFDVSSLSLLVHKHGGRLIGSISWLPIDLSPCPVFNVPLASNTGPGAYSELGTALVLDALIPHALFFDCTHDNEMPAQKRTVEDLLPNAALVSFCASAIGSVYGYDEMYPKLLDVVGETRHYNPEMDDGIGSIKAQLHAIRRNLVSESDDCANDHEMYIHHEGQYITIQRTNAKSGTGWFLIARTRFDQHDIRQELSPCKLGGTTVEFKFANYVRRVDGYERDSDYLTGIAVKLESLELPIVSLDAMGGSIITISSDSFPPGSIAVFQTKMTGVNAELDTYIRQGVLDAVLEMNLIDINAALYRCEAEERDASESGTDTPYNVPGVSPLVYAGFEGWIYLLKPIINNNDLGNPLCDHLREGFWAFDYIVGRLDKYTSPGIAKFQKWLKERADAVRAVPYFYWPHYFALVVGVGYMSLRFKALSHMLPDIMHATTFVQSLALTSVQMVGRMKNTCLMSRAPEIPCIAAGLPHFSNDYMRCWGRDVFISFRGLFLIPGRYNEARQHILGFAQTLKHGLIPNLLDAGRNPRYNARDAVWFFFEAVQDYIKHAPNGEDILDAKIWRRFPLDDTWVPVEDARAFSYQSSISDVLFEILQRHARGIDFREANAGPKLDSQMKDEGFNVKIFVDWTTGLVHGGLQFNCGTWMDKMGESEMAHNRGVPGTPRDGAAIELQGLLKSSLRFVNTLAKSNMFSHHEVERNDGSRISLVDWEALLSTNFERCFYVPSDPKDDSIYDIDSLIVNRRGIYKDLYRSGKPYEDYQLRPNLAVAMCVAPELFDASHAAEAIRNCDIILRGPVGMRTLDPLDWNYRPDYTNSVENTDFATSKGRNYHQGPEWVWCFGYFMRAFYHFALVNEARDYKVSAAAIRLRGNKLWIKETPWAGLTELTNMNGSLCADSSPTQAWSTSCLLDFFHDSREDSLPLNIDQ